MGAAILPYSHEIDGCLSSNDDGGGLTRQSLATYLNLAAPVLDHMHAAIAGKSLAMLSICRRTDDIEACAPVVDHLLDDTSDLVFFGTGGSSLGAQTLAQLAGYGVPGHVPGSGEPRAHFFDNLDVTSLNQALARLDLKTTRFLVVSKSGGTAETLAQTISAIDAVMSQIADAKLERHFAVITEKSDNPLRRLAADTLKCPILQHEADIPGRFSVLSNVGLLPAMCLGLDPHAVRRGAALVLDQLAQATKPADSAPALGAALSLGLAREKKITSSVLMPYADRLDLFAMWYRQLWAESLGKNGKGTTPIKALGPVDQHSQLQLYLDGPADKLFTLIITEAEGQGPVFDTKLTGQAGLDYLSGRSMGDLVTAEQRATADTLIDKGRPVRLMKIKTPDEMTLGALFMHFMLETIITAHMLEIDPFDQPAVEQGKILAKKYLADLGS